MTIENYPPVAGVSRSLRGVVSPCSLGASLEGASVYGCEALWGQDKGAQMREMIEAAIGEPCPCAQGEWCRIVGDGLQVARTTAPLPLVELPKVGDVA